MENITKKVLQELIQAAEPFTSGNIVDETDGTIPLMERLEKAIKKAKEIAGKNNLEVRE